MMAHETSPRGEWNYYDIVCVDGVVKLSEVVFSADSAENKTRIDGGTLDVGLPSYKVVVIEVQMK